MKDRLKHSGEGRGWDPRRRGFILIIVLGLLGLLAVLAVSFSASSRSSRALSSNNRLLAQARLLARSGAEHALRRGVPGNATDLWALARSNTLVINGVLASQSPAFQAGYQAELKDGSGRININDGIAAGRGELGSGYRAGAIDPWPVTGRVTPDASGWINLRIRRLLNAYGDSHKFVGDIGLPPWTPGSDPNYGTPFMATGTAMGDRFTPDSENMTGLGDILIANRPDNGYRSLEAVRDMINTWGSTYLGNDQFFEVAADDLTTFSWEDREFFRFNREFADWSDDVGSGSVAMKFLDSDPPDLDGDDLWIRHPVATINLNASSLHTKASIFASMAQVEYMCEGMVLDDLSSYSMTESPRDSIGRGGVVFGPGRVLENGVDVSSHSRKNLFLSMYDALVLAQALNWHADINGPVRDWTDFEKTLADVRAVKRPYERATSGAGTVFPLFFVAGSLAFDQAYVEKTLPHVLSPHRCLPGWLGAPLATLRPYLQEGLQGDIPDREHALRSVEDFVYRCHLPKIMFLPGGRQRIVSTGEFGPASSPVSARISLNVEMFSRRSIRSQQDLQGLTDVSATSANVVIGPEPPGVDPDECLGVVGLNDQPVASQGPRPKSISMSFNGDLQEDGLGLDNYPPTNPALDPFAYDGNGASPPPLMATGCSAGPPVRSDKTFYQQSQMEDETHSMFVWGEGATNISPFGGLLFSSIAHGPRSVNPFADSLYWRPETMLGAVQPGVTTLTSHPGATFGQGTINFWWRNPSGYRSNRAVRQMFQLTTWQHERAFFTGPSIKNVTRPYEFLLFLRDGRVRFKHSHDNPGASEFAGGQRTVYGREVAMPLLPTPFSNPPAPNPPSQPVSNGSLLSPFILNIFQEVEMTGPPLFGIRMVKVEKAGPHGWADRHALKKFDYNGMAGISVSSVSNQDNNVSSESPAHFLINRPPGSWNRFSAGWDLRNYEGRYDNHYFLSDLTAAGTHALLTDKNGGSVLTNLDHMILTFGEQLTGFTTSLLTLNSLGSGNTPSLAGAEPDYLPLYRFNSLIDNIDVRFGSTGGINHASSTGLVNPRRFFDTHAPTKTKRYDITLQSEGVVPAVEPRWVIDPDIEDKKRILMVGARVYDVPEVASGHNSPWVELSVEDPGQVLSAGGSSDPGSTEPYMSTSWSVHEGLQESPTLRLVLTYKATDPTGSLYLNDYLCDIPWIKEVFWITAPQEPRILDMSFE